MTGADLKRWRVEHAYTQEQLRLLLGVSRQTIITWEASTEPLTQIVQLALIGLEHAPKDVGKRLKAEQYSMMRNRPDAPGSKATR